MFKIIGYLIGLFILGGGGMWIWNSQPSIQDFIKQYVSSGEFHTLEARYTAEQIMESNRKTLLKEAKYSYLEPTLKFYPYALMEVKYTTSKQKTAEGLLLWSLDDGELVLDTSSWDCTHGLEDCINVNADKNDFKILKALSKHRGYSSDRKQLLSDLHVETEALEPMLDSCLKKKLIVQKGNEYRLHFNEPKLATTPETKIEQWLVTKPYKTANCAPMKYSLSQIETIAKSAFDNDFTIRNVTEVYLPVYSIVVQNPDNSILTTYWNALNGKRLNSNYFK